MHLIGYRTRLRPGQLARYTAAHARIPEPIARALRAAGVTEWNIWSDGETLFHTIRTTDGLDAMSEAMASLGPIDRHWDELIATMVDDAAESAAVLPLVWHLDGDEQGPDLP